jgi:Recombination endonuclease VII
LKKLYVDLDGGLRKCGRCGEIKPLELFLKLGRAKNGRGGICKSCCNAASKAWAKENPAPYKATARRTKHLLRYGITQQDYESMFVAQNGVCAICSSRANRDRLDVDHCHSTGKVRGLLCGCCNSAIGLLRDNPALIMTAAKYVEANQ